MADRRRSTQGEVSRLIARIDAAYPRASLIYARMVVALLGAVDRTMSLPDLSEKIGKSRDSSAVQRAAGRLCEIGVLTRELVSADREGGRSYLVQLTRTER